MPAKTNTDAETADAILRTFISPNEVDSNWEAANVVDGLFAISRSIYFLAETLKSKQATDTDKKPSRPLQKPPRTKDDSEHPIHEKRTSEPQRASMDQTYQKRYTSVET